MLLMPFPALYLIADPSLYHRKGKICSKSFFKAIDLAIESGVQLIQYRDKSDERGRIYQYAERLRELTAQSKVKLIINDEVDIAMAVAADGVHLGQEDFPVAAARSLLGAQAIIGLSTHSLSEALAAEKESVDYIGFGPIFSTETKSSDRLPLGIESISELCTKINLPIYAIGGIQLSHVQSILSAGATGVAIASALVGASKSQIQDWVSRVSPDHQQ